MHVCAADRANLAVLLRPDAAHSDHDHLERHLAHMCAALFAVCTINEYAQRPIHTAENKAGVFIKVRAHAELVSQV